MPTFVIITPFNNPNMQPMVRAIIIIIGVGSGFSCKVNIAETIPTNPIIEPIERSRPPAIITIVIPAASTPETARLLKILLKLIIVR